MQAYSNVLRGILTAALALALTPALTSITHAATAWTEGKHYFLINPPRVPAVAPGNKHVFHLYPVQIDPVEFGLAKDDFVYAMLHERGIKVGTHYTPLHYSTAFQKRGFKRGQFPVAEKVTERLVTLPINPRQTREALDYLIESICVLQRR